jgi:hypothetical protein
LSYTPTLIAGSAANVTWSRIGFPTKANALPASVREGHIESATGVKRIPHKLVLNVYDGLHGAAMVVVGSSGLMPSG